MSVGKGFLAIINIRRIGIISRIINFHHTAVGKKNFIHNRGHGGNQIKIVFTVKAFLNNLKVKKAEKSTSKSEAQCTGGFRLIG